MDITIVLSEEEVFAMCIAKALDVVSFRVPKGKQFKADFVRSYSGDVKVSLVDVPQPKPVEPGFRTISNQLADTLINIPDTSTRTLE